ncbi:hypothetical protein [Mucilaginibacter sp.]
MRKHILSGILMIGALALGSCSTAKLAASNASDDDVYYTKAKAGDRPTYAQQPAYRPDRENEYADVTPDNEDEYYYDDSYSARINRFGYASPFGYYDDYYYNSYGYAPYGGYGYGGFGSGYGGYGYGPYGYGGLGYGYGLGGYYGGFGGFGFGLGYGFGYGGFGYGGFYGGYPYGYGGYGYGGGYGGWGAYSAYRSNPRPYLGSGIGFRNGVPAGRNGATGVYGGRPTYSGRNVYGGGRPDVYGGGRSSYGGGRPSVYGGRQSTSSGYARPQQSFDSQRQSTAQPRYTPPPAQSSGSFGGGGGFSGGRSGGGGGRSGGGRP